MRSLFGSLFLSLLFASPWVLRAAGNPITFVDCNLHPDQTPSGRATPGLSGGFSSPNLVGTAIFRNETDQPLQIKAVVVHVKDGYDKPLFDLPPLRIQSIPPHQMGSATLSQYYTGAVTVFRFSCDITVVEPQGGEKTVSLTPQSQGALSPAAKSPGSKPPGY